MSKVYWAIEDKKGKLVEHINSIPRLLTTKREASQYATDLTAVMRSEHKPYRPVKVVIRRLSE